MSPAGGKLDARRGAQGALAGPREFKMAESNAQKLEKAKAIVLDSIVKVGVSTNQSQAVQRLANAYALLDGSVAPISSPNEPAPKSA